MIKEVCVNWFQICECQNCPCIRVRLEPQEFTLPGGFEISRVAGLPLEDRPI
ncbi:MAG: hypothetical protein M2R45_02202 [Verrucomicrobia subdivision 3 bacterium]|nr:hypothetical protein [Limisphaerales bacterium]MCS1413778.1 hypothetical protein [Limisphaerales bacterium]